MVHRGVSGQEAHQSNILKAVSDGKNMSVNVYEANSTVGNVIAAQLIKLLERSKKLILRGFLLNTETELQFQVADRCEE